jgi:tyrosyl-tRNA synthetase
MDVDLEIGGNDQMFNMLCGRDLMKAMRGKEKCVLTMKLLADSSGNKMGKTEGNAVFLDQEPFQMFENIMNWSDGTIGVGFELCTKVPFSEVKEIQEGLKNGKLNPRETKLNLAEEFVKLVHGKEKANKAREDYISISNKKVPEHKIQIIKVKKGNKVTLLKLLTKNYNISNSQIKRLIEQGAVKINDIKVTDFNSIITQVEHDNCIIKVGVSNFFKVKFE